MRGFFGIGCYQPKTSTNLGTLWRSCLEFNAGFMFTVAARCFMESDRHEPQERIEKLASFAGQPSNTTKADRHIPLFVWPELKDMTLPTGAMLVGIEQSDRSTPLESFTHPEQAVYILGAEDRGLSEEVQDYCTGGIVHISTHRCLNVAVAGSIVMYDRALKKHRHERKTIYAGKVNEKHSGLQPLSPGSSLQVTHVEG